MNVPDGYKPDGQGRLVKLADIKPVDLLRDELVLSLVREAKAMAAQLEEYRARALGEVAAFYDLAAEKFGVKRRKTGGNISLLSFDGRYKVVVANDDQLAFNEGLATARQLIWQCMERWTEGSRPELRALVDAAFKAGRNGKISVTKVLMLRQVKIEDAQWLAAMDALSEALQVCGTRTYLRIYVRTGDDDYALLPLDVFPRESTPPLAGEEEGVSRGGAESAGKMEGGAS